VALVEAEVRQFWVSCLGWQCRICIIQRSKSVGCEAGRGCSFGFPGPKPADQSRWQPSATLFSSLTYEQQRFDCFVHVEESESLFALSRVGDWRGGP